MEIRIPGVFHSKRGKKRPMAESVQERKEIDVEAFYTRYGPMVLRRCRKLLGNEQAACDAMQEVFLKVLARGRSLTGDYPSALLFRIATNVCLNKIRDDRTHGLSEMPPWLHKLTFSPSHEAAVSAGRLLDHLFRDEGEEVRRIAVMHFVDGMTLKEIGDTVNLSTSGVHKRLEALRRRIQVMGGRT